MQKVKLVIDYGYKCVCECVGMGVCVCMCVCVCVCVCEHACVDGWICICWRVVCVCVHVAPFVNHLG